MGKSKNSDASFIMQGSILAIASIISRIVGLIYRIPLTASLERRVMIIMERHTVYTILY